jgi:integrase/recombinase XerD
MTALSDHAADYLQLRRALGHKLEDAHRLLPRFVACLDAAGATTVTVEAALAWARRPDADPASSVWTRRMAVARGFAGHLAGIDPGTERALALTTPASVRPGRYHPPDTLLAFLQNL